MSFEDRSRNIALDVRKYMRESRLPSLLYHLGDGLAPTAGHASHRNHLSVRPEGCRRLETMYCIDGMINETVGPWLDHAIPSGKIRTLEPDPETGECLAIPNPIPKDYSVANLVTRPDNMTHLLPWFDRLPLVTVQRILHLTVPETRGWGFRANRPLSEPDAEIWSEYLWTPKRKRSRELTLDETSRRVLVAIQPPWILTDKDLSEFILTPSFPPLITPERGYLTTHETRHRLWGKIWDSCVRHKTRYWVLTSYSRWVFGVWSPGYTIAFFTDVQKDFQCRPELTILELLSFWIASGMRLPKGYVSPKVAEPFFVKNIEPPPLREHHEYPEPASSDPEWGDMMTDIEPSAGVAPSMLNASDDGVSDSLSSSRKIEKSPFVERWVRHVAQEGATGDFQVNDTQDLVDPPPRGLPFVFSLTYGKPVDENSKWVGQWLTQGSG